MSEQGVIGRLEEYGAWVQTTAGLALRPGDVDIPPTHTAEIDLVPEPLVAGQPRGHRTRVLAAVAAALIIAGAVIASSLGNSPAQPVVTTFPQDPSGPLFMLPDTAAGFTPLNGFILQNELPTAAVPTQIVIVGTRDGESYRDLMSVSIGGQLVGLGRELPGLGINWEQIETAVGPAQLIDDFITTVAQERDGAWISVLAGTGRASAAIGLLEDLTLGSDGRVEFGSASVDTVLADFMPTGSSVTATAFDVASSSSVDSIIVETATGGSPLGVGGAMVEAATPWSTGWHVTRQSPEGEWNGIVWQATPNRIVAVSGHSPLKEVQAVAESLTIVDEATWKAALPGYTEE